MGEFARHAVLLFCGTLAACSSGGPSGGRELTGTALVSITNAPPDGICIEVDAVGDRTVTRKVDVAPGDSTVFHMAGLPLGTVIFSASAFGGSCGSVTPMSVPNWVSDPTTATVAVTPPVAVFLEMHRNGNGAISVDFPSEPLDGAPPIDAARPPPDAGPPRPIVVFSPPSLDFGQVLCGFAAPAQTVTFSNAGSQPYVLMPQGPGGAYSVSLAASGVVAPGQTESLIVTPAPIPPTSPGPGFFDATLIVTTNAPGDSPHVIPLTEAPTGVSLALQPLLISFGSLSGVGASVVTLPGAGLVVNTGYSPAGVSLTVSDPARFSVQPASGTAAPSGGFSFSATFTAPLDVLGLPISGTYTASLSVQTSSALCAPPSTATLTAVVR